MEVLLARKLDRGGSARALATALHWGEPLCESELTLIQDGGLYYRGRDASELARSSSLEEVIELLWGAYHQRVVSLDERLINRLEGLEPLAKFRLALPWLELEEPLAYDLRPESVRAMGARILSLLFGVAVGHSPNGQLAESLALAWAPEGKELLQAALILCADHELNVSAFTARCVASAGANPYQVVAAGLAALSGHRHGGHCYRVEAFYREVDSSSPAEAIRSRLRRGESIAGFGHQLYPQGDPRATTLLGLMSLDSSTEELLERAWVLLGERPNIDFALVTLGRVLGLPQGAPIALFALGRTVGWVAHALEQYRDGKLIRPRARYVGASPDV